jgi:hypothetical protein
MNGAGKGVDKPVERDEYTAEEAAAFMTAHVNAVPRKPLATAAEINKANAEFWEARALPPPPPEASTHPGLLPLVRQANLMTLRATSEEAKGKAESATRDAVKAEKKAEQDRGIRNSAEARKNKNVKRDRRIHDAYAAGKTPKQIEGDEKIRGKKKLTASQIRRILKAPRP